MKHHNGIRRINKVDGGKGRARRTYARAIRRAGKREVREALNG